MPAQTRRTAPEAAPAPTTAGPVAAPPTVENSVQQSGIAPQGGSELDSELLGICREPTAPFETGSASRGDFVWAIARQLAGQAAMNRADAVAWAEARGIFNGKAADNVSRAEAAVMLRRFLGLTLELPKGQVAYFSDVDESSWYFADAHTARRHGLYVGCDNKFQGDAPLTVDQARTVLLRAKNPAPCTPEQQSPGRPPMLEPDALAPMLEKDELSAEEIAKAREKIAKKPEEERGALYKALSSKVQYRNQRDNAAKYAKKDSKKWGYAKGGDVMCNVTSMAMALNQLGIGADESKTQLEDQLDETMVEGKLGSRYDLGGQRKTAAAMGAKVERVATPNFKSGAKAEAFYTKRSCRSSKRARRPPCRSRSAQAQLYHIVRLEWVESTGLTIDDPFGTIYAKKNGVYSYETNDATTSEGAGAKGEDRSWSWDTVASVNRGRYVQLLTTA